MKRRDFLAFRTQKPDRVLDISLERLYVRFVDADAYVAERDAPDEVSDSNSENGSGAVSDGGGGVFQELKAQLADVDVLRVRDVEWLVAGEFRDRFEALVLVFRARGGRVDWSPTDVGR